MILRLAWAVFGFEILLALVCGVLLWYFWSHSAMRRSTVKRALAVYTIGCIIVLLISLAIPI